MLEIRELIQQKAEIINNTLKNISKENESVSETLQKAMNYTLFSGGKRIRPVLTLLVCEMISGNKKAACRAGAALEYIHSYSLIHDDLPVMDDDDLRRGKPANHRVFGPGIAVLAGDGLLTRAFGLLAQLDLASDKIVKIIRIVARAAGEQGMVGGQVLDLEAEDKDIDLDGLIKIHNNKTGALFRAAILTGACCGEVSEEEFSALDKFAENLGLLFQIVDDILDVTGNSEELGKEAGSDKERCKSTYVSILGLEGARKEAEKTAQKAVEALEIFGDEANELCRLVEFVLNRKK